MITEVYVPYFIKLYKHWNSSTGSINWWATTSTLNTNRVSSTAQRMPCLALTKCHAMLCFSESQPQPELWEVVKKAYIANKDTMSLIEDVASSPGQHPNFSLRDGLLLFKVCVWVPGDSVLQSLLIAEFHSTPTRGHARIQRTLSRLASVFYLPAIKQPVKDYVSKCGVC